MSAASPALEVSGLELRFGGIDALKGVGFSVAERELLAVIGPNGAGKTSIFNCVSGAYRPNAGTVSLHGEDITGRSPVAIAKAGVARTFQNLGLFTNLALVDNLMLGRHAHMSTGMLAGMLWLGRARREEREHREYVEDIIDLLRLDGVRSQPVGLLPYGIQKRIELGRALAMSPTVLLLDEPVAGMNQRETDEMAGFIEVVRAQTGVAVVLVEHDMGFVMGLADRVLAVDFGSPLATGTPVEIQSDPAVIRAYLGDAAAPAGLSGGAR